MKRSVRIVLTVLIALAVGTLTVKVSRRQVVQQTAQAQYNFGGHFVHCFEWRIVTGQVAGNPPVNWVAEVRTQQITGSIAIEGTPACVDTVGHLWVLSHAPSGPPWNGRLAWILYDYEMYPQPGTL